MKPLLVIETLPFIRRGLSPHQRNTLEIVRRVPGDLVWRVDQIQKLAREQTDYKHVLWSYGSFHCPAPELVAVIRHRWPKAKLWWMTNEYECRMNHAFLVYTREHPDGLGIFTNVAAHSHHKRERARETYVVNLNTLIVHEPNEYTAKTHGAIYWGTFRPDRAGYFNRYLQAPVTLSCSSKNYRKFYKIGCKPKFIDRLQWDTGRETLNHFAASIYIEDVFTHSHYNCPANRFYEACMCNAVNLVDANCRGTFLKAGITIPEEWYVSTFDEVVEKTRALTREDAERQYPWIEQALVEKENLLALFQEKLSA